MATRGKKPMSDVALMDLTIELTEQVRGMRDALEQQRIEMAEIRRHQSAEAVESRDDALAKVVEDVQRLRGLIEDDRTPAEQGKHPQTFANVLKAPGIRKATNDTFAARARVGRAAKKAGMRLDEWVRWCAAYGWADMTVAPSMQERARAEGQTALFSEDAPAAPKRPRGRPKGSKDKKPRKKRASTKKTSTKSTAAK